MKANEIDELFERATGELREQVDIEPLPKFHDPYQNRQRAAFALVVMLLVGVGSWAVLQDSSVDDADVAQPTPGTEAGTTTAPSTPDTGIDTTDTQPAPGIGTEATDTQPVRPAPGLLERTEDPAFGTTTRRLTSPASAESGEGGEGSTSDAARFHRLDSQSRPTVSADGRWILAQRDDQWTIVDRSTGEYQSVPINRDAQPSWHPTDAQAIRHLSGDNASTGDLLLYETRIDGTTSPVADLSERIREVFPEAVYIHARLQGAPSADGSRFAWAVFDEAETVIGFVAYDLTQDEIIGTFDGQPDGDLGLFNSIAISKNGDHVVLVYQTDIAVFDTGFTNERRLGHRSTRYDTVLTGENRDVLVTANYDAGHENAGWLVAHDLADGSVTRLHDLFDGGNPEIDISGAAVDAPGWVLASTFGCGNTTEWACDRVMAMNIDDGTIINLALTNSCAQTSFAEPLAVTNTDLTLGWFNTDSGSCGEDASIIELEIPAISE